ncbi:hypothetical protein V8C42DRAFT_336618 [Trichoderma barbatum]
MGSIQRLPDSVTYLDEDEKYIQWYMGIFSEYYATQSNEQVDADENNVRWYLDIFSEYYAAESNEQAEASELQGGLDEQSPATADSDVSVTTQP